MKFNFMTFSTLLVASSIFMGTNSFAQGKKSRKSPAAEAAGSGDSDSSSGGKQHRAASYGMAGCGLGSLLISSPSKWSQVSAATLNGTGSQGYGISTGTSNCKVTSRDLALAEQQVFVNSNLASLTKDAAKGDGEHLAAFAEILGCERGQDFSLFGMVSQKNFTKIFTSEDSHAVLVNYRAVIKADEHLAKSCIRA